MINLNIPTSWDALSDQQLKNVARLLFTPLEPLALEIGVLFALMSIKWWRFLRYFRFKKIIQNYLTTDLKKHYAYIYDNVDRKSFISVVTLSRKRYYPPKKFLYNLTVSEFAVIDDIYIYISGALKNGTPILKLREDLETMAAILYQEEAPDIRTPFLKEQLDALCKPWSKAPLDVLLATYITYQGCRTSLEKRYTRVFSGGGKKKGKQYGFGKVILQMAGKKFGSYNETNQTYIHTFLEQLNEDLTPEKLK